MSTLQDKLDHKFSSHKDPIVLNMQLDVEQARVYNEETEIDLPFPMSDGSYNVNIFYDPVSGNFIDAAIYDNTDAGQSAPLQLKTKQIPRMAAGFEEVYQREKQNLEFFNPTPMGNSNIEEGYSYQAIVSHTGSGKTWDVTYFAESNTLLVTETQVQSMGDFIGAPPPFISTTHYSIQTSSMEKFDPNGDMLLLIEAHDNSGAHPIGSRIYNMGSEPSNLDEESFRMDATATINVLSTVQNELQHRLDQDGVQLDLNPIMEYISKQSGQ